MGAGGSAGKEAAEREHAWQLAQLPEAIRALIVAEEERGSGDEVEGNGKAEAA